MLRIKSEMKNQTILSPAVIEEIKHYRELAEILESDTYQSMNQFRHHGRTTCYDHCLAVACATFIVSRRCRMDFISATRGALLHDLYLYDWHTDSKGFHGFRHPFISLQNAEGLFSLNDIERDAIIKHMWPLTPIPPKYPESFLVSMADKIATLSEYCNKLYAVKQSLWAFSSHVRNRSEQ